MTDEKVGDSRMFGPLIDQSKESLQGRKIEQADAYGAYDTRDAFNKLAENNIKPAIKIRSNTSTKARGSPLRAKHAREYLKVGYKSWKKKYDMENAGQLRVHFHLLRESWGNLSLLPRQNTCFTK